MNSKHGKIAYFVFLFFLCSTFSAFGALVQFDFGLPIFSLEELRLEQTKTPGLNLTLFKKFLGENENSPIHHFQAIFQVLKISLITEGKIDQKSGLIEEIRKFLKVSDFKAASKQQVLDYFFFEGLVLANLEKSKINPAPEERQSNQLDKAFEEILIKAEDKLASSPDYFLAKGILFFLLKDRPNGYFETMKPLEDLKRAASTAPSQSLFHFVLGQAFRLLGNEESSLFFSVLCYERAAALSPSNPKLQHTLLGIYMGLHEYFQGQRRKEPFWLEEAVYKKILVLSPKNPHALNNLGYLYAEYGIHPEQAQNLCQQAVDLAPDNAGFKDSLGWAAFKNGQNEKAEKELVKSIQMNSDSYEPHYHLGTLYYVTKRIDKAIECYQKAVELNPNSSDALNNYAFLLAENSRDIEKAYGLAKRAIRIEPDNPSFLDTLGWLEFQRGNSSEALRLMKKAVNLSPDVGEILAHLGKIYLECKDFSTALVCLKQAFKADSKLENIKHDIYLTIVLKSFYIAIAEYHKLFRENADQRHLQNLLLQIARVYQEEGEFSKSIEINHLCEKLQKSELDLSKPIFNFYELENATAGVLIASEASSTLKIDEHNDEGNLENSKNNTESGNEDILNEYPPIVRSGLALNLGPAFFRFASKFLNLPNELTMTSFSIFLKEIKNFQINLIFKIEIPEIQEIDFLSALEAYYRFFRAKISYPDQKEPKNSMVAEFSNLSIWTTIIGDDAFIGFGKKIPGESELASYSITFPYDGSNYAAFLIDWPSIAKILPSWLHPFVGNPIWPFLRIYVTYSKYEAGMREVSIFEPTIKVDREFVKKMADSINIIRSFLKDVGILFFLRIEANDNCLRIKADYDNFQRAVIDLFGRFEDYLPLIQPWLLHVQCYLRRCFGEGCTEKICPTNGKVISNPFVGWLSCESHKDLGCVPFIISSQARCKYSRIRLKEIIRRNFKNLEKILEKQRLLEKVMLEYNIPACSAGGVFEIGNDEEVSCSFHDKEK
ncbi:MAG: tetratricopeptide repeat protein [Candidatus Riflebacteria bacterium]|nr:tetratricopeptide repeat protein [Candidatus Riflebacteria bacterium]